MFFIILVIAFADANGKNITNNFVNSTRFFQSSNQQTATCYEQLNGYGPFIKITQPIKNLNLYGWDNKISSCCFTGFWLLYEDKNFNNYHSNVRHYQKL